MILVTDDDGDLFTGKASKKGGRNRYLTTLNHGHVNVAQGKREWLRTFLRNNNAILGEAELARFGKEQYAPPQKSSFFHSGACPLFGLDGLVKAKG